MRDLLKVELDKARSVWLRARQDFCSFIESLCDDKKVEHVLIDDTWREHSRLLSLERSAYRDYRKALLLYVRWSPFRQLSWEDFDAMV